jgi:hypothetical protein
MTIGGLAISLVGLIGASLVLGCKKRKYFVAYIDHTSDDTYFNIWRRN